MQLWHRSGKGACLCGACIRLAMGHFLLFTTHLLIMHPQPTLQSISHSLEGALPLLL